MSPHLPSVVRPMAAHSPISLTRQGHVRRHRDHPFCYICGEGFTGDQVVNRDHVPPENIFLVEDRVNFPLKMNVHKACHDRYCEEDERVGQLMQATRGEMPTPERDRRGLEPHQLQNGQVIPILRAESLDLNRAFFRYVRAFHAALYDQPLPEDTKHALHSPAIEFVPEEGTGRPLFFDRRLKDQSMISCIFRQNVEDGLAMDAVVAYNMAMIYECFWRTDPSGPTECFFCLRIYNSNEMGAVQLYGRRACVGRYRPPPSGLPAQRAKCLPFRPCVTCLDPYGPPAASR